MAGTKRDDLDPVKVEVKVLLVDDHRDSVTSLAKVLGTFGYEPEVCFDGASALDRVQAFVPDVAILDIRLPDVSGAELCRQMRALDALRGTVFVALTGAVDDRTLADVDGAGFHRKLAKPVQLQDVLEVLKGVGGP